MTTAPTEMSARPDGARVGQDRLRFARVSVMDLAARTGYQMGKKPLLPLFAAALGASEGMTGLVVAISTITGLATSTLIGALSDRYGRRRLILAGTALFAFMPFVYLLVQTPGQLLLVRLVHGFATAIYGPVVTATVADLFQQRRAEYIGWYRSVRTASYLLGPLLGGLVLVYADFRLAWIVVGILGLIAFLPALALPKTRRARAGAAPAGRSGARDTGAAFLRRQLLLVYRNPALLTLGVAQAALYLGLRANGAFLPLYGRSIGVNAAQIGIVFSVQIAATLLLQPLAGRLADRWGRNPVIVGGLLCVAAALPLMVSARDFPTLLLLGAALGLGEAAISPSLTALGTELSDGQNYGSALGMLDAMDNVGKALGPLVAGLLLGAFSYVTSFTIIAALLVAVALLFWLGGAALARDSMRGMGRARQEGITAAK